MRHHYSHTNTEYYYTAGTFMGKNFREMVKVSHFVHGLPIAIPVIIIID